MSNYLRSNPEATKYVLKSYEEEMKNSDKAISSPLRLLVKPVNAFKKIFNRVFKHNP